MKTVPTILPIHFYKITKDANLLNYPVTSHCRRPEAEQRHLALLKKNSTGMLTTAERAELALLREQADQLMLRKAYAWALLQQRGEPISTLEELVIK